MNYQTLEKNHQKYIAILSAEKPIASEQDALDIIAVCMENEISRVLIHAAALADDFFDLSSRLAGNILLKLGNYRVKTVVVLDDGQKLTEKFEEFMAETNRGTSFAVFRDKEDAENWLLRQ